MFEGVSSGAAASRRQSLPRAAQHHELAAWHHVTIAYSVVPRYSWSMSAQPLLSLQGRHLQRLTHDHTLVAEMISRGALQPKEAAHHRLRHVITNASGPRFGVNVECHRLELEADDMLLLCPTA